MFLFLTTKHTAMIKVSKSVGVIHKSSFCPTKTGLHTLYYSLVYSYFQYCILVWGLMYPTHLRRLVLLQKRIIRIISKKGPSTLTLIHYLRVLRSFSQKTSLLCMSGNLCFLLKITQFLLVFPDPFYVLIKFMVITRVVQINYIFLSAIPTIKKVFCFFIKVLFSLIS